MEAKQGTLFGSILILVVGLGLITPLCIGIIQRAGQIPIFATIILSLSVIAWVIKVIRFAVENCKSRLEFNVSLEAIILIFVLILFAVLFLSGKVHADSLELDRAGNTTQIQLCVERPVSGKVGAFAYSCQTETWSEAYVGLTYAPVSSVQVAFGAGQETGGNRFGGWLWAGKGRFSGLYCLEDGKSGTWDKLVLKCQVTDKLSLGYTKKMYAGEGVYMDFKVSKTVTLKYSGFKTPELTIKVSF